MPLKPGTKQPSGSGPDGYADSMAEAMEIAFKDEWKNLMTGNPPEPNEQMRLMFIAIARGVVKHLKDNPGSFKVSISTGETGQVSQID